MKLNYSTFIVNLVREIEREIASFGDLNNVSRLDIKLRKNNQISTIISTCEIEGTKVTSELETLIRGGKRLVGDSRDICELRNVLELYDSLENYNPFLESDFKRAHKVLTQKLLSDAGRYRSVNVGVGSKDSLKYIAPLFGKVPEMMKNLFIEINNQIFDEITLSCYTHLMIETIHPFVDGNGRIGRFWQTLFLSKKVNFIFYYINIEGVIKKHQKEYHERLNRSQKSSNANYFVEFMLQALLESILLFKEQTYIISDSSQRLLEFKKIIKNKEFSRKDYLGFLKTISPATATRDLSDGVLSGALKKTGKNNQIKYSFNSNG